jgi:mRNA-degrading endonuclease RelE of RelBE toxin-antitoxin system
LKLIIRFRSGSKDAAKRHRSFLKELERVFSQIEEDPFSVGDQIKSDNSADHVRKVRIGAPGDNVLPRAGYRLIFQVLQVEDKTVARCLDLYYKKKQVNVLPNQVGRLVSLAAAAQPTAHLESPEDILPDLEPPVDSN